MVAEDRGYSLYELTKSSSDILKHPGGHFVPNSKIYVDNVANWIESHQNGSQVKSEKPEDDIDSLLDMMDNFGKA